MVDPDSVPESTEPLDPGATMSVDVDDPQLTYRESGTVAVRTVSARVTLDWAAVSHVGHNRRINEDSVAVAPPVFAVADGMGGHDGGDVASALAVSVLSAHQSARAVASANIEAAIEQANALIVDRSGGGDRAMGTTVTGVAIADLPGQPRVAVFNVGDSRTYLLEGERLTLVTHDHSHVQELIDRGLISPEAANSHPERNVVTRALGAEPTVEVDLELHALAVGQRWLVCSDGLTGELDHDMCERTLSGGTAPSAADRLLAAALDGAARDNVTALVLDVVSIEHEDDPDRTDPRAGRPPLSDTDRLTGSAPSADLIDLVPTLAAPLKPPLPDVPQILITSVPPELNDADTEGA